MSTTKTTYSVRPVSANRPSGFWGIIVAAMLVAVPVLIFTSNAFAQAPACNAAHITAPSTPLQMTATLPFREWRDHQRADEARWCPNIVAADLTWYTTRRPALVTLLGICSFADVGITDVQTADQVPCRTFDLESLPPGAAIDFFDRLGGAIPGAINGLPLSAGLKTAMQGFPNFAMKGADPLTDVPAQRDAAWAMYYAWLRQMGYTPVGLTGTATPNPDTEWTCPAPAAAPTAKCQGYEAAALATVKPVITRVQTSTVRTASAAGVTPVVTAYDGDAKVSQDLIEQAEATTPPVAPATVPTFDNPLHRRILHVAAAWQNLAPRYQAFYQAEVEGREALASLPADAAGLEPLTGQKVTVFRWGQEAMHGTAASVALPVIANPLATPPIAESPARITVQPEGTPPPAAVVLTATEINGTPAAAGPPPVAAVPATVRVFVKWPEAWKAARNATNYHGRSRILTPADATAGLPAFKGREVEVVSLDRRTPSGDLDVAVEVLDEADTTAPSYTLHGGSATTFNVNRAIFFGGSEGGGGTAVSLPEGVTLTPQLGMLMCTDGDATCVGGTEGALLRYALNNNVALVARVAVMQLGTWRHDADQFEDTAQWSPLVTLGVNPGFSAGNWRLALLVEAGTAGLGGIVGGMADITYANTFNFALGYARLLHVQGDENQRLFRELPRRFDGGALTGTVGWMF